jgi:glucose/mannose transport system permease protein
MAVSTSIHSIATSTEPTPLPKRRTSWEKRLPIITLIPSLILLFIFVYGFIVFSGWTSLSNWTTLSTNLSFRGFQNYALIFQDYRFQSDLRNVLVFTILFIIGCLVIGMFLALMIDQRIKAESLFRSIFIFPMAISFIVTGVVWQWVLNPGQQGSPSGINILLHDLGMHNLPQWFVDPTIWPSFQVGQIQFGIPVAMISVVIAAVWQMSGFAMAIYLAGLRAIPEEIREAAKVDGAGFFQTYWKILLPELRGMTGTLVIMLTASSLKIFDLIKAMTGPGTGFTTDMPSMDMFTTTFQAQNFANGAAISIVLLILVAAFIVPYLISNLKGDR